MMDLHTYELKGIGKLETRSGNDVQDQQIDDYLLYAYWSRVLILFLFLFILPLMYVGM